MKVCNAFSLQMLPEGSRVDVKVQWLTLEEARKLAEPDYDAVSLESQIGHADFARVISNQLGVELPMNRVSTKLVDEESILVAQYVGGRLPEGATSLPDGAEIRYALVKCSKC